MIDCSHFRLVGVFATLVMLVSGCYDHTTAVVEHGTLPDHKKPSAALTVDEVITWLPPDTETLVVANGPFPLRAQFRRTDSVSLTTALEGLAYRWLAEFNGVYLKELAGHDVTFALEGARGFTPQLESDENWYEGCHVIVFKNDLGDAGDSLMTALETDAQEIRSIAGREVFLLQQSDENGKWKIYFCQPTPKVILRATQEAYLQAVLQRIDRHAPIRAFPVDLAEWKHIDRNSRFWMMRHFKQLRQIDDFDNVFQSTNGVYDTVGMVVNLNPFKSPILKTTVRITYVGDGVDVRARAVDAWTFGVAQRGPNVVQTSPDFFDVIVELANVGHEVEFLSRLRQNLGHESSK